ncbi:transglycosylase domain-containing protein [Deinococcus peraridilitoris]|uniref:peptidoglycan glycosyltransferase n=1 Tax=Deinococcus peraridilitoris (strain DSM 19664 / LMG 22246 / CIP 109416 / KR-200) TaxID=937777 RepID=L0A2M4_DEIPD|nr:transglycosylase domain-containing protein [Deinococcus peraridilitoris]AFZ68123.1 membrane carboxypeptidase (penicillin-binding protein) [Deinococcus peraridilitoris DSM 19664]
MTGVVASGFVALLAFLGGLFAWGRDLPSVSDLDVLEFSGQSRVFDRDGQLVGTLAPSLSNGARVNRTLLKLDQVSPFLRDAVVTSEDRRFFNHHGIDFLGIARGLWRGLRGDLEGGSTLTQQLVKNTLLADLEGARTPERKFKEAILAVQVDRNFSKDEILGAYLNVIYWGSGGRTDIIGAATASRSYLQKDARNLNLAESVYLATLIPSPGRYFNYPGYRSLMRSLLERMVEDGRVSRAQADAAWRFPLQPAGWRVRYDAQGNIVSATLVDKSAKNRNTPVPPGRAHLHFLQAVERELIRLYGRKAVYSGTGLKVYTTMDLQAQTAAERASRDARLPEGATLGMAFVEPGTGEVLALVGQKLEGFVAGEWNNATQARRQVGSAIKPLLYTLALEKGGQQYDTVLDAPISGDYQPRNYSGRYLGTPVTLRYALNHSLNLPTVRLAQEVGVRNLERKLSDLGLSVPTDAGLSLAIGTLEASPLQLASAYATFANGGEWHEPRVLRRVVAPDGRALPLPTYASRRVWDAQTAFLGLDMLRGVVNDLGRGQGGLAWRARIPGWDVGGKTGTTNDVKDLWFAGVTPGVAGAVWVGRQEGGAMPENAYSGDIAAPVWQQAVAGALAGRTPQAFGAPEGVAFQFVRGVRMAVKEDSPGLSAGVRRFFERSPAPRPQRERPQEAPAPTLEEAPLPEAAPTEIPPTPDEPSGLPQPEDLQPTMPEPSAPEVPTPSEPIPSEPVPAEQPPLPGEDFPTDTVPVPQDLQPLPEPVPPVPDTSLVPEGQQYLPPEEPQSVGAVDNTY